MQGPVLATSVWWKVWFARPPKVYSGRRIHRLDLKHFRPFHHDFRKHLRYSRSLPNDLRKHSKSFQRGFQKPSQYFRSFRSDFRKHLTYFRGSACRAVQVAAQWHRTLAGRRSAAGLVGLRWPECCVAGGRASTGWGRRPSGRRTWRPWRQIQHQKTRQILKLINSTFKIYQIKLKSKYLSWTEKNVALLYNKICDLYTYCLYKSLIIQIVGNSC